jgi:hypothetical protein
LILRLMFLLTAATQNAAADKRRDGERNQFARSRFHTQNANGQPVTHTKGGFHSAPADVNCKPFSARPCTTGAEFLQVALCFPCQPSGRRADSQTPAGIAGRDMRSTAQTRPFLARMSRTASVKGVSITLLSFLNTEGIRKACRERKSPAKIADFTDVGARFLG